MEDNFKQAIIDKINLRIKNINDLDELTDLHKAGIHELEYAISIIKNTVISRTGKK